MKILPLKYLVCTDIGVLEVDGYAIDSGLPVRLAVRRKRSGGWVMDHYDTGLCIGRVHKTREGAIRAGIEIVKWNLDCGYYAVAVSRYNARREE